MVTGFSDFQLINIFIAVYKILITVINNNRVKQDVPFVSPEDA